MPPGNAAANFAYTFDTTPAYAGANLTARSDGVLGTTESFCYDSLNRLVDYSMSATCTGAGNAHVAYDAIGNILSKSDAGTYTYPASGASSVRPHAVSAVAGTVNGVANPSFTYDANGNLVSGANRTVAWTSFNMVQEIVQGTAAVSYAYDASHARIAQTEAGVQTTFYFDDAATGAASERRAGSGGAITWVDYIFADGQRIAQRAAVSGGATTWSYFIQDHLGSTAVILDGLGAVSQRFSFDPWGKRTDGILSPLSTRRFTGHEEIPSVGLVNMNARIYDPELARFMSADPTIPDPFASQSFNRFSYVNNNPLSFTDPTGLSGCSWPYCVEGSRPGSPGGGSCASCIGWDPGIFSSLFYGSPDTYLSALDASYAHFVKTPMPEPVPSGDNTPNTTGNPAGMPNMHAQRFEGDEIIVYGECKKNSVPQEPIPGLVGGISLVAPSLSTGTRNSTSRAPILASSIVLPSGLFSNGAVSLGVEGSAKLLGLGGGFTVGVAYSWSSRGYQLGVVFGGIMSPIAKDFIVGRQPGQGFWDYALDVLVGLPDTGVTLAVEMGGYKGINGKEVQVENLSGAAFQGGAQIPNSRLFRLARMARVSNLAVPIASIEGVLGEDYVGIQAGPGVGAGLTSDISFTGVQLIIDKASN